MTFFFLLFLLFKETHHVWTKVGTGFTLHNSKKNHEKDNVLHTFLAGEKESRSPKECKLACDKYDECRFISADKINKICILFKRANTVKAKKHTKDELLQKFGVTTNVESWQSDAALRPKGTTMDAQTSSDLEAG